MQTKNVPMETLADVIALQLQNGGRANLTVTGNSMLPLLRHRRDCVTLIPPGKEIAGDILLYRRENGQYILHRFLAVRAEQYICCGDNQYQEETINREQVLAVVDGFTRKGKTYTLQHPIYRLYCFVWVKLFTLRPLYIFMRRLAGRIYRKIRRKQK